MTRRPHVVLALGALAFAFVAGSAEDASAKPKRKPSTHKPAPAPPKEAAAAFDREAAAQAVSSVDLQKCRATNAEKGEGHVMITFAPAGAATSATIDKGPWIGTPVAKCIAGQFKKAKVPAFAGEPVTVGKTFRFE